MKPLSGTTVGEIVAANYNKARVFQQFGIDFCCGGKKTLAQVCAEKNIDQLVLEQALSQANAQPPGHIRWNFKQWDLAFLTDFIVNAHHTYVRDQIPRLRIYGEKVAHTYGGEWPEVIEMHSLMQTLSDELLPHLEEEETILFPYIKNLVAARQYRHANPAAPFGAVQNPVRIMETAHESMMQLMHAIGALKTQYKLPNGAYNTFQVWSALLYEFADDLCLHLHLENNILFPGAIALEESALQFAG